MMVSNAKKRPAPNTEHTVEKPKPSNASMLSFADELEEDEGDAAFSLADTTRKRFETERPLILSPSAASPSRSYFQEYATSAADTSQKPTLGHLSFGASHARGARPYMEDRHTIIANYQLPSSGGGHASDGVLRSFVAVFDGHNGADSAEQACSRLHHLLAAQKGVSTCLGLPGSTAEEAEGLAMKAALENSFLEVDGEILSRARQEDPQGRDGACAVVAVRVGDCLWTAHAGDSRAVLARGGTAVRLTEDHKPGLAREAKRVKALGGRVEFARCWRIISTARGANTGLAVSRSLGDLDFKEPIRLVESRPDVGRVFLQPGDAFVILASDGLWDVLSDQAAVDIAKEAIRAGAPSSGSWGAAGSGDAVAKAASSALVMAALKKGTLDNITSVIMLLHWGN